MELEPKRMPTQFSLASLLAGVLVVTAVMGLASILMVALKDTRFNSKITACKSNLKNIGLYLQTYVSRYGNDVDYPTCRAPVAAPGLALPGGTNGAFWSHLWVLPAGKAVCTRPGDNSLFQCYVYGGPLTIDGLDYSGPNLANTSAFPGGKISDRVYAETYIGGDLLIPGDCNHGDNANGPIHDFNGLRYDGSVQHVVPHGLSPPPGSDHFKYLSSTDAATIGVRTP